MKLMKHYLNLLILGTVLVEKKRENPNTRYDGIGVFVLTNKTHFFLSILSVLSLNNYIPNLHYRLIDDGSLNSWQLYILHHMLTNVIHIEVIANGSRYGNKLKKYPYCYSFFRQLWCGKKFFIPLLSREFKKCIVLDSDALFIKNPTQLTRWIMEDDQKSKSLYLKDYMNFSAISPIESEQKLKVKITAMNLNSGLLCINTKEYWHINSLKDINSYLSRILRIQENRMIRDFYRREELQYFSHALEQTLFQITLSKLKSHPLPSDYALLKSNDPKTEKVFIHFTPDGMEKEVYYKYLQFSLRKKIKLIIQRKWEDEPWYTQGNFRAFTDVYLSKNVFRTNEEIFLHRLNLLVEQ